MTIGEALWGFAVVAALLTIIPGLDTALVLRASLTQSRSHAYATALGICAGALVWGAAAAVGASALLQASALGFAILKLVGAAYMLWFGITLIPVGVAPLAMGLLLALVHVVEVLIWFSVIIVATQYARRFLSNTRISRWIDRATGGVLVGFAGVLAWESRS